MTSLLAGEISESKEDAHAPCEVDTLATEIAERSTTLKHKSARSSP
jgi:hypothetical protein